MSSFSPNQLRQCARFTGTACTPEKEQKLREQIHSELAKIKYCSNPTYSCSLMRLDGYEFCIRHILRDPRANYRQCTHVFPNGRKCANAVPKLDTKKEQILTTLCFEHNRQAQLQKTHLSVGRLRSRVETNETLLNNLSHHVNVEDVKAELPKPEPDDDEIDVVSPHVTPFGECCKKCIYKPRVAPWEHRISEFMTFAAISVQNCIYNILISCYLIMR